MGFSRQELEWVAISFSRGIFLTQGSNPDLPHCRQTFYRLSYQGSPWKCTKILHVSVHVQFFFKWRPLVLHYVLREISDQEDVENHWLIIKSKPVHNAQHSHGKQSSLFPLLTHPIRKLSSKWYAARGHWGLHVGQSVLWLSLIKLPIDKAITFLSLGAESLHDPKHIFFKKSWAYLCPDFAHTHDRFGKSFFQGKNTSLSFPLASLFWKQRPFTPANNAEYLPCRFLFEDFTEVHLRLRIIKHWLQHLMSGKMIRWSD